MLNIFGSLFYIFILFQILLVFFNFVSDNSNISQVCVLFLFVVMLTLTQGGLFLHVTIIGAEQVLENGDGWCSLEHDIEIHLKPGFKENLCLLLPGIWGQYKFEIS